MAALEWNEKEAGLVSELVGIPYVELGTTESGVSCSGLAILFFRKHGVPVVDPCSTDPDIVCNAAVHRDFIPLGTDSPRYGDVAAMEKDEGTGAIHTGIWTPNGILHANEKRGVIVTHPKHLKIVGYYRHRAYC